MTHKDIYTKFMIEYDKADITSSYPSLTEYEIATLLDKAYLALLALKLTGNNPRLTMFESDNKAIEDVRPLIYSLGITASTDLDTLNVTNEVDFDVPDSMLYYIDGNVVLLDHIESIDNEAHNTANVKLVTHEFAQNFMNTATNLPWMTCPVLYIENSKMHVLYDSYKYQKPTRLILTYIQKPNKFALENGNVDFSDTSTFLSSDTMAEELINLALLFATKITDNQRLTTEVQTRSLES